MRKEFEKEYARERARSKLEMEMLKDERAAVDPSGEDPRYALVPKDSERVPSKKGTTPTEDDMVRYVEPEFRATFQKATASKESNETKDGPPE